MIEQFDHGWPEFWDLWATDRWEVSTHDILREVLDPGDLFLDVGAWIGPVTMWAHQLGAHVIAVEPDPIAWEELMTVAPRERRHYIELWKGALTVGGGPVFLAPNPKPEGAFGDSMSRLVDERTAGAVTVQSWTLKEILCGRVPDLVKMDVEGYEMTLVPAIIDWLTENRAALHISCHGEVLDRKLFAGYREVRMPTHPWGDIVALP